MAWQTPAPGDIVWCRFPELPRRSPGLKPRPALVCDVEGRDDGLAVSVAYGMSQQLHRLHAGEFLVTKLSKPAAYSAAGLSFDTKFNVAQTAQLPWTEEFFAVPPRAPMGQNPELGSLQASVYRAAQAAQQAAQDRS